MEIHAKKENINEELSDSEYVEIKAKEIRENVQKFVDENPSIETYAGDKQKALNLDYDSYAAKLAAEACKKLVSDYNYSPDKAIVEICHKILPSYDFGDEYSSQSDELFTIEQMICFPRSYCRTCEPLGSKIAQIMGYPTTRWGVLFRVMDTGDRVTHTFFTIDMPDGRKKLIDTTNSYYCDFMPKSPNLGVFKRFEVEYLYPIQNLNAE